MTELFPDTLHQSPDLNSSFASMTQNEEIIGPHMKSISCPSFKRLDDTSSVSMYDVANSTTQMILLNNRLKKANRLRGQRGVTKSAPGRRHSPSPNPERHLSHRGDSFVNRTRHASCQTSQRPPVSPFSSSLAVTGHVRPPRSLRDVPGLMHPDLTTGQRNYLFSTAHAYSQVGSKALLKNGYYDLLRNQLRKVSRLSRVCFHSDEEYAKYTKWIFAKHKLLYEADTASWRGSSRSSLRTQSTAPSPRSAMARTPVSRSQPDLRHPATRQSCRERRSANQLMSNDERRSKNQSSNDKRASVNPLTPNDERRSKNQSSNDEKSSVNQLTPNDERRSKNQSSNERRSANQLMSNEERRSRKSSHDERRSKHQSSNDERRPAKQLTPNDERRSDNQITSNDKRSKNQSSNDERRSPNQLTPNHEKRSKNQSSNDQRRSANQLTPNDERRSDNQITSNDKRSKTQSFNDERPSGYQLTPNDEKRSKNQSSNDKKRSKNQLSNDERQSRIQHLSNEERRPKDKLYYGNRWPMNNPYIENMRVINKPTKEDKPPKSKSSYEETRSVNKRFNEERRPRSKLSNGEKQPINKPNNEDKKSMSKLSNEEKGLINGLSYNDRRPRSKSSNRERRATRYQASNIESSPSPKRSISKLSSSPKKLSVEKTLDSSDFGTEDRPMNSSQDVRPLAEEEREDLSPRSDFQSSLSKTTEGAAERNCSGGNLELVDTEEVEQDDAKITRKDHGEGNQGGAEIRSLSSGCFSGVASKQNKKPSRLPDFEDTESSEDLSEIELDQEPARAEIGMPAHNAFDDRPPPTPLDELEY